MTHAEHPLTQYSLQYGDQPFPFYAPTGDDTIYGTISCLQRDLFHFADIPWAPGDVAIDIGCNVGLVSTTLARAHPEITVYGFDASPTAVECFRLTAASNRLINAHAFPVAVGATEQRDVCFLSNGKDHSCLVQDGMVQHNPTQDAVVNMVSFESLFDSLLLGITRVKYLKMDIEGGEFPIFERLFSARPDILDRIDYLHLEVHANHGMDPAALTEKVRAQFGARVFFDT